MLQNASRLEAEADLSLYDLRQFLRMKGIKQVSTESILGAQAQSIAAHSMAIFLLSSYLTQNIRAFPGSVAELLFGNSVLNCFFFFSFCDRFFSSLDRKEICRLLLLSIERYRCLT